MRPLLLHLAQLLLKLAVDRGLERSLPKVFERVDAELPVLLSNHAAPVQVSGLIGSAIADATGRHATAGQINAVISLYNPVAAALRNIRR